MSSQIEQYNRAAREKLFRLLQEKKRRLPIWWPFKGPQTMAADTGADITGYGGAAGGGKGLAIDTPIATTEGWKLMAELAVGDLVFDQDGHSCSVTAISDIQYRGCYRLTFDDGSTLVADDVHRWMTFDAAELSRLTKSSPEFRAARRANRPSRAAGNKSAIFTETIQKRNAERAAALQVALPTGTMRDTALLASTLRTPTGRVNHAIRMAGALVMPNAKLPIPPYTLGAWLGDGSSRNGQLTGEDAGIWLRIEQEGFRVRHYDWSNIAHNVLALAAPLREAGLRCNKHIPAVYMRASVEQRLALLQGLMDSDGHAARDGGCEFDNTNERLARDVLELALSLGLKATIIEGAAKLNGVEVSRRWRVRFTTSLPVFGLTRKLERLNPAPRRTNAFRYLVSCEKVATVPTRCIAVDSPARQYLAGRSLIPTHNTDLVCGTAMTKHKRVLVMRREKAQTEGILQRLSEIVGSNTGYNSQKSIWRIPMGNTPIIEFGGLDNPGDEKRWQGRPHDLKAFDEVTEMREYQVRFCMGWMRSNDPKQRCRVIMTFNPPTTAEGRWVIEFFGPWLDPKHKNPAMPGELRWFASIDGKDAEMPDSRTFVLIEGKVVYDFDPAEFKPEKIIKPKSRTFIPARVTDNPVYMQGDYMSTLQSLPEPLRSQMLYGDFTAGMKDDAFQVIPTAWVDAAMERWKRPDKLEPMDSLGVDVARGGSDNTIMSRRHGMWFDELLPYPGKDTPDGPTVAGLSITAMRDRAVIHIDVIGVGSSPYDYLRQANQQVVGVCVSEAATGYDKSGVLKFFNLRSQLWWNMREALDPANNTGIALPPDKELAADLCTPTWKLSGKTVQVQSREDIYAKLKRSPDRASAVLLALMDTPKIGQFTGAHSAKQDDYNPYRKQ